jgi:hypothetical protein
VLANILAVSLKILGGKIAFVIAWFIASKPALEFDDILT